MKIVSLVECEPLYLYIGFYLLYLLMFTTLENQTSFTIVAVMWKRKKLSVSMLMPFFVLFFSASFDLRWKSTKSEICGTWLFFFDLPLSILKVCRRKVAAHTIFILLHLIRKEDYSKILIFTQSCLHWKNHFGILAFTQIWIDFITLQ